MTMTKKNALVVAVDFSACSDEALHLAWTLLQQGHAERLHLIYVLDPRDVIDNPEKPALITEEEVIEQAPRVLCERARYVAETQGLPYDAARVRAHARIGRTVPTLIQTCVDYEADLLIVGTHGRHGMERVLLGSVAEALVREAPCPVLVARAKDYQGRSRTALPDPPYAPGDAPQTASPPPFERTVSTSNDSWRPSDSGPTGFRIV